VDGPGNAARFSNPTDVAIDGSGNLYVSDLFNYTVRQIDPSGEVTTLAGKAGEPGGADGFSGAARFAWPTSVAVDGTGNVCVALDSEGSLLVAHRESALIRRIRPTGEVTIIQGRLWDPANGFQRA
jgi:DNA-binding beta-propeller fold protein YncE